jgi:hypothetical protein
MELLDLIWAVRKKIMGKVAGLGEATKKLESQTFFK